MCGGGENEGEHRKLRAADIGINAPRGCCTDCFCLIMFGVCWAVMIFFTIQAFRLGDLDRLIYGVDYQGNVCSKNVVDKDKVKIPVGEPAWDKRQFLYYPIAFSITEGSFIVKEALDLGVCVEKCPGEGDEVKTYGDYKDLNKTTREIPKSYTSLFKTEGKFHRCLPDFFTFSCENEIAPTTEAAPTEPPTTTVAPTEPPTTTVAPTEPPTTTVAPTEPPTTTVAPTDPPTTTVEPTVPTPALRRLRILDEPTTTLTPEQQEEIKKCKSSQGESNKEFKTMTDIANFGRNALEDLRKFWYIVVVCSVLTIVIAFVWLFCLRRLVKPITFITIACVIVGLAVLGYFFFDKSNKLKKEAEELNIDHGSTPKMYFYGAVIAWVVDFLFICLTVFLCESISTACDIIEEGSKIPVQMKTTVLVPPIIIILIIPLAIFCAITAAATYTAAKPVEGFYPIPGNSSEEIAYRSYKLENWRTFAYLWNVFMFLWTMGWFNAIGFMIIALCAVFWYWSAPGDDKNPTNGVWTSLKITLLHHLGTVAFGAFIVACVQFIRFCLELMEARMKKITENSEAIRCILNCARCCLAYFERFIKFINKNAYILCAMTGESFLPAARHALQLLTNNILSVGAVTVITNWVMIFGKLLITAAACGICYVWVDSDKIKNASDGAPNGLLLIIVVGVLAYFISCIFFSVLHVCVDVVLLSYCYDIEQHNGTDKPYYFPSDLAKHVDKAREKMEAKEKARAAKGEGLDYQELKKPIN